MTTNPDKNARNAARDAIIERIRKLSKMTTANGCSEAEAEVALRHLAKLSDEYNVTQDELSLKIDAEGMLEDIFIVLVGKEGLNWTTYLKALSKMNDVRLYMQSTTNDELFGFPVPCVEIHIFGYPVDVGASIATMQIVQVAMKTAQLRYKPNMGAKEKTAFQDGFASRIGERIDEMRRNKELAAINRKAEGQQLVVLKDKLVAQEWQKHLDEKGIRLGAARYDAVSGNAQGAGRVAANEVNLGGKAVGSDGRRIGRG